MRNLYLTNRFFGLFGSVALFFVIGYILPSLYPVALTLCLMAIALCAMDVFYLFQKNIRLKARRHLPKLLSLGDDNSVRITLRNNSQRPLHLTIIDELPFQFQKRDFEKTLEMQAGEEQTLTYELMPVTRGEYEFGVINIFAATSLGLAQRRFRIGEPMSVPVYPSVPQMKRYEMLAFNRINQMDGMRKIRRIGHSYEFEQIKDYVRGDDYRSINWKATGRQNKLMVNQYEDERSQQIYCIIDKSRAMRMPFGGHEFNGLCHYTSLAISNIALKKYDRAGLISFSDKIGATLKADRRPGQLNKILHALYK